MSEKCGEMVQLVRKNLQPLRDNATQAVGRTKDCLVGPLAVGTQSGWCQMNVSTFQLCKGGYFRAKSFSNIKVSWHTHFILFVAFLAQEVFISMT